MPVTPLSPGAFGLHISAANHLETLAAQLADEMRRCPGEPLAAERIVVPHPALGRWLRLALATELGVAANLRVELPAEFAWSLMREAVPSLAAEQPFAPANLRWRIFALLGGDLEDDQLRRYLADAEPRKRFELADRLAHVYDRCLLYRPDWIRAWQSGDAPHWQARLWLALSRSAAAPCHWVDAVDAYRQAVADRNGPAERNPAVAQSAPAQMELDLTPPVQAATSRASFFGMASLSPSYLEMLRTAAGIMDVHLYLLSPCREFWADIRAPREQPMAATADDYFTAGNELLAAWGRVARDMQALLAEDLGTGTPRETYLEPAEQTRLAALQHDILDLRPAEHEGDAPALDDSLQIHVCHSAMREAEVLHDRLLGLFDAHPDIEPADVQVLASSLTDYAPAIEAVFGAAGAIPFNIGRLRRRDNATVQAFLDLLALPGSRYGARAVLAPLRAAAVQARFGIDEDGSAAISRWLDRAGIRWGIDAEHLQAHAAPAANSHTWRAGIRRLLLGYAIDDAVSYNGVVPCTSGGFGSSDDDYERLGRFVRYCEQVFELAAWQVKEQTPSEWADDLRALVLDRFFADEPGRRDVDAVARLIDEFADECQLADCTAPVPFAVLRQALNAAALEATRAAARLAEGVTVGQLASGRIHPAKVVCAIGMDGRAFPRHVPEATFDLVGADGRRLGDRDARDEDRFAFLEALLAARRCFIVTYTGRDLREDAPLPPSVLVSELTEYLHSRFGDAMETHHPLQPFSRRYFEDRSGRLFSYSQAMAAAANAMAAKVEEPPRRLAGELADAQSHSELDIDELVRFATAPTRYFVERCLGMQLRMYSDDVQDEEPIEPDSLRSWQLKSNVLALSEADVADETVRAVLLARGMLPQSNLGVVEYRQRQRETDQLATALTAYEAHRTAAPVELELEIADLLLVGAIDGFSADANEMLWWRVGDIRPRDRIEVWLKLLALTCATSKAVDALALGVADSLRRVSMRGPDPETATKLLTDWLEAWRRGNSAALPFFPATSWAWASEEERSLQAARAAWHGNQWGEGRDDYNHLAFPDEPFDAAFEQWAKRLLGPLVQSQS